MNADTENCPITSCTLKSAGCSAKYEGLHVKIAEATPFQLTASVDVIKGYEESVCVECVSKLAKITKDNFKVTQTSKCVSTLSLVDNPMQEKKYPHSE